MNKDISKDTSIETVFMLKHGNLFVSTANELGVSLTPSSSRAFKIHVDESDNYDKGYREVFEVLRKLKKLGFTSISVVKKKVTTTVEYEDVSVVEDDGKMYLMSYDKAVEHATTQIVGGDYGKRENDK